MLKTSTPDLQESSFNHKAEIPSSDELEVSMICTKGHGQHVSHHSGTAKLVPTNLKALANLVEAQVPIFRGEMKEDAFSQIAAYFHCSPDSDCTSVAQPFLHTHSYHCVLQFNHKNMPTALLKKPYMGNIMVHLMKGRYFNGSQSVGVLFAEQFNEIVENKSKHPEVTIPMVALTSTAQSLFLHIKILEDLRMRAPEKFHKLMADIFEAIQKLSHNTIPTTSHVKALAFLNIDGMDSE
ncbi:hypothetical protein BDR07DRAFT_1381422 [Suillus spraguei]|nr:hypothetical protein BDR07DRAFT_1381422 [Suillus spraguei]